MSTNACAIRVGMVRIAVWQFARIIAMVSESVLLLKLVSASRDSLALNVS